MLMRRPQMAMRMQFPTPIFRARRPGAGFLAVVDGGPAISGSRSEAFATAVRFLAGTLLIGGAFLKVLSPEEAATLAVGYRLPMLFSAVVVQLELFIGVMLLAGCYKWFVMPATCVLFSVFAAFSLFRAVAGFESCGCFGALRVSPWFTLALDLCLVCATWLATKHTYSKRTSEPADGRWKLAVVAYLALGATVAALSLWMQPTTLKAGSSLSATGDVVILKPSEWIGQEFPLIPFMSPQINMNEGIWTVLMYHHDCPQCRDALPKYIALAEHMRAAADGVLLLELPPYATNPPDAGAAEHARLSADREWFVEAPVEIITAGGLVKAASVELPSIALPRERTP